MARAKDDPACRLLMTVPGIGPMTALAYVSTIGDAKPPRRLVMAQTLIDNRQTNRRVKLHAAHLPPPP